MPRDVAGLFDAMAATYDELEPWYTHLYAVLDALLRRHLAPEPGRPAGRALDAGCGTGFQTTALTALGYAAHGVDVSPGLLGVARAKLPRAALALATLEALPYREASFEAVACCGSTLSFVEAPARALRELARVLRPGGRLLLECEHRWSLDLLWALGSSLARDALGYGLTPRAAWRQLLGGDGAAIEYPGYGRLRLFRARELSALLVASGLRPVRIWGIHAATNVIPSTVLHRPQLPRGLRLVYRALCALDGVLLRAPGGWVLANSIVILARKAP